MSMESARAFRLHVNGSPALQVEVAAHVADGAIDYAALAMLGARHGYAFSAADVRAALVADEDELSDFEMELVSGGSRGDFGKTRLARRDFQREA